MQNDIPIPTFVSGTQVTLQLFGDSHILIHHNKQSCLLSELMMLMLVNLMKANDDLTLNGKAPASLEVIIYKYGHKKIPQRRFTKTLSHEYLQALGLIVLVHH